MLCNTFLNGLLWTRHMKRHFGAKKYKRLQVFVYLFTRWAFDISRHNLLISIKWTINISHEYSAAWATAFIPVIPYSKQQPRNMQTKWDPHIHTIWSFLMTADELSIISFSWKSIPPPFILQNTNTLSFTFRPYHLCSHHWYPLAYSVMLFYIIQLDWATSLFLNLFVKAFVSEAAWGGLLVWGPVRLG